MKSNNVNSQCHYPNLFVPNTSRSTNSKLRNKHCPKFYINPSGQDQPPRVRPSLPLSLLVPSRVRSTTPLFPSLPPLELSPQRDFLFFGRIFLYPDPVAGAIDRRAVFSWSRWCFFFCFGFPVLGVERFARIGSGGLGVEGLCLCFSVMIFLGRFWLNGVLVWMDAVCADPCGWWIWRRIGGEEEESLVGWWRRRFLWRIRLAHRL